ncbi:hypothetical protein Pcinc_011880 [Petrolisthes cinctipes]|uniref:Mutator-like transposase domain-containing protein n=1 Tax=Petrolisthes cinctipes TaxID=88211 RepID=A0AAE1G2S4_PETCI|nr:hypothetical protein Pcinc_011880 [Petrolisthes cinctipes]
MWIQCSAKDAGYAEPKAFSSTTYAKYAKFINEKSIEMVKNIDAPAAVVEFYATELNRKPDENGILDIDVSDGSWHTPGHKSLLGTGAIIDVHTGLVLDYENLSKFCTKCNIKNAELKKNDNYRGTIRDMDDRTCFRV